MLEFARFPFHINGDLNGKVERIGADTVEEETVHGKESYYQVLIRTDGAHLMREGRPLPIIPGMVAEVDILNGKRSVLNYLLRPIIKARLN